MMGKKNLEKQRTAHDLKCITVSVKPVRGSAEAWASMGGGMCLLMIGVLMEESG